MNRDIYREISKVMEEIKYDLCVEDLDIVTVQYLPDFEHATQLYIISTRNINDAQLVYFCQYKYCKDNQKFSYMGSDKYYMRDRPVYYNLVCISSPNIHVLVANLMDDFKQYQSAKIIASEIMRVNKKEIGLFITLMYTTSFPYNKAEYVTRFYRKTPDGYIYEDSKTATVLIS